MRRTFIQLNHQIKIDYRNDIEFSNYVINNPCYGLKLSASGESKFVKFKVQGAVYHHCPRAQLQTTKLRVETVVPGYKDIFFFWISDRILIYIQ
jgi:hypothetical protein